MSEGAVLGREERLSLSVAHLDSLQASTRIPTAQAQLSAGASHTCGIKANNTVACWGQS